MFVTMTNGMAISSGLNGDMQMWDIATCEYEGNLYSDPTVKVGLRIKNSVQKLEDNYFYNHK